MSSHHLYRDLILDHYKRPRHQRKLSSGEIHIEKLNPSCGDRIRIHASIEEDLIADLICELQACAISVASASLMAEAVRGKSTAFALALRDDIEALLVENFEPGPDLGDLSALVSVREFPVRIPCAMLPWNALRERLSNLAI